MAGIFRNGEFIELPTDENPERLEYFLDMAGLIGKTERMMRDPELANLAKLERESRSAEKKRIQKEAIAKSKKEFKTEYARLAKLSLDEHVRIHTDVVYDLENNYDPKCVDERSVPETDTDRGLPDERISNNCMCFVCRPENYSDKHHQRWKTEQKEARLADIERKKTEEAERQLRSKRREEKQRRLADEQRRVAEEQRLADEERKRCEREKIVSMRQNQILPTGWSLNTSSKFPGKRYFQYDFQYDFQYATVRTVSLWESKTDKDGNVSFGWGTTPSRQIIDIYSEDVVDTLSEMGLL
jgi:hypothetical protein